MMDKFSQIFFSVVMVGSVIALLVVYIRMRLNDPFKKKPKDPEASEE